MQSTTKVTCMVFVILIGAQLFNLTFRGLGGEETVHELLSGLPGGAFGAMLAVMLVMFVLGFFLDFLEIVFVVVPIMAPVLFSFSNPDGSVMFSPVWVAVMIGLNLQTSFLTPPFGFALFYLRGVAPKEVSTMDIYKGVLPFVMIPGADARHPRGLPDPRHLAPRSGVPQRSRRGAELFRAEKRARLKYVSGK